MREHSRRIVYKRVLLFIVVIIQLYLPMDCCAHNRYTTTVRGKEEIGHDNELEQILFGKDFGSKKSMIRPDAVKAIEDASYLAIDQFQNSVVIPGQDELNELVEFGIYSPFTVPKIEDLSYKNPAHHRVYTHEGWNFKYPIDVDERNGKKDKANWKLRKSILIDTVRHEFGYVPVVSNVNGDAEWMESFAKLVYYIHLLGDIESTESLSTYQKNPVMPLAFKHTENNKDYIDIICEIRGCCEVLFIKQKENSAYKTLMRKLDHYHEKVQERVKNPEGASGFYQFDHDNLEVPGVIKNEHSFNEYRKNTTELNNMLKEQIPELLGECDIYEKSELYSEVKEIKNAA